MQNYFSVTPPAPTYPLLRICPCEYLTSHPAHLKGVPTFVRNRLTLTHAHDACKDWCVVCTGLVCFMYWTGVLYVLVVDHLARRICGFEIDVVLE